MSTGNSGGSKVDIFQLLEAASSGKKREKMEERERILDSLRVRDYFEGGEISIDTKTCRGSECKLCIDVCPTHALYWKLGEVGVEENLCVYCTACVLSCIVDDCIHVHRRRPSGEEEYSNPRHVLILLENLSLKKRVDRVKSVAEWERRGSESTNRG